MSGAPEYDVLIAGAGPAGAHTALRLAHLGWSVAVLDSHRFPRKKPCGEFLSPACLPHLEDLGLLEGLYRSGAARVSGMDIFTPRHRTRGDYLPIGPFAASHGHGLGIRRELLDAQAVQAARSEPNITTLLGWRVSRPLLGPGRRVVGLAVTDPRGARAELRSRFTVGADGLHSRVARALGWAAARRWPERFALVARFEASGDHEDAGVHVIGKDYFAACPIDRGQFTANLVVDAGSLPRGRSSLEPFFRERLRQAPFLAEQLSESRLSEPLSVCGPLRARTRRCTGPGVALVGDACGFVDPITGEGLFFAMHGASLLAPAIDRALREPALERTALREYARARRREFTPRHALARLVQLGLRRPGVPDRVVGTLERIPALCDLLLGLTGDYVPPRGLVFPSVWRSAFGRERPAAS